MIVSPYATEGNVPNDQRPGTQLFYVKKKEHQEIFYMYRLLKFAIINPFSNQYIFAFYFSLQGESKLYVLNTGILFFPFIRMNIFVLQFMDICRFTRRIYFKPLFLFS